MYEIYVKLSNRTERIPFYSKWAAGYFVESKGLTQCADVEEVLLVDTETGEVLEQWL